MHRLSFTSFMLINLNILLIICSQQLRLEHLFLPLLLLLIRSLLSTSTPVAVSAAVVLVEPVKVAPPLHYSTSPPHHQPLSRLYASYFLPN